VQRGYREESRLPDRGTERVERRIKTTRQVRGQRGYREELRLPDWYHKVREGTGRNQDYQTGTIRSERVQGGIKTIRLVP
jgi:hypothetical protein